MTQVNSINNDEGFSGVGTPWFRPKGQTVKYYWGNPISLKFKMESETKTRESRRAEDAGEALSFKRIKKPTTGSFSTDSFVPVAWAVMLLGADIKKTVPSQTRVEEPVTAVLNGYFDLPDEDIDGAAFELSDKATGTPIDKENYQVNPSMGVVQVKKAAGIAAGTELQANYTTEEVSFIEFNPAAVAQYEGEFGFDGRNTANNDRKCKVYAPNMSTSINGDIEWVSEDFVELAADLVFAKGKNGEDPITVRYYD